MRNFNNKEVFDYEIKRKQYERMKQKKLEQRRRDNMQAIVFLVVTALVIMAIIALFVSGRNSDDTAAPVGSSSSASDNSFIITTVSDKSSDAKSDNEKKSEHKTEIIEDRTYIDGILIVNKSYSLPSDYNPGLDTDTLEAFNTMKAAAAQDNVAIDICSSFRSYDEQYQLYNLYASERGTRSADEVSARPGHSEHQTGLAIDVNTTEFGFENTPAGQWLDKHCYEYGFIIRFPKGKEEITGYDYEPWHIRYVGVDNSKKIHDSGLCLEEYLGVKSEYKDDPDTIE